MGKKMMIIPGVFPASTSISAVIALAHSTRVQYPCTTTRSTTHSPTPGLPADTDWTTRLEPSPGDR